MEHGNQLPQQQARQQIDCCLIDAGWVIQDKKRPSKRQFDNAKRIVLETESWKSAK